MGRLKENLLQLGSQMSNTFTLLGNCDKEEGHGDHFSEILAKNMENFEVNGIT